jgi:putative SOS response-associated peptidase YedK
MCGRFTLTLSPEEISRWFDIDVDVDELDLVARYNIAPTQSIPVIRNDGGRNRLNIMRWGLVPPYEKEFKTKYLTINARDDKILESRIYKGPFMSRRCLIPASGFYEWKRGPGKTKQPMMIRLKSGEPFAFAGIWERWLDRNKPDSEAALSCSIITTRPNSLVGQIHDRMPVILPPELYQAWLNPENQDIGELKEYLLPYDPSLMEACPVSSLVNSVKNDGPELIEPV